MQVSTLMSEGTKGTPCRQNGNTLAVDQLAKKSPFVKRGLSHGTIL